MPISSPLIPSHPIRVGVLGAARISPTALIRPARSVEGIQVVGVAARDPLRARRFAADYGLARAYDSYEELLADPHIDGVYVPLPATLHADWVIAAIEAGKHVLCEKPFASNSMDAARVAEVAAHSKVIVMEAYHSAYHPLQDQLRAILNTEVLGHVFDARAVFCIPLLSRKAIQWNPSLGGGGLLDVGYYPVRQLRDLFGEPTRIIDARARQSRGVDRRFDASMQFAGGVRGEIVTAIMSRRLLASRLEIRGAAGTLSVTWPYHPQSGAEMLLRTSGGMRVLPIDRRSSYMYQLESFRDSVQTGLEPRTGVRQAVTQMSVIDRVCCTDR